MTCGHHGLKGLKDVRLQFGISTHEENRAPGETVAVSEISIVPQGKVDSGAKIPKKIDLKFQQKIRAEVRKLRSSWMSYNQRLCARLQARR